jgi:thiosulfate/3-mercaptopyruvate sulfurtransferase
MSHDTLVHPALPIEERGYARPDVLVSADWVAKHIGDPTVRLVEANEDRSLYRAGHIQGAVELDWVSELNDPLIRDYIDQEQLQTLLRKKGINQDTTIVLYGDKNNWWATYNLWVLRLFGIERLRILDGGRALWQKQERPLTTELPAHPPGNITIGKRDDTGIRAFRKDVFAHVERRGQFVDVRSPEEFRGDRMHMPDYPNEGALRGGHIPGARNVPWARAVEPDSYTFKPADALRTIYLEEQQLDPDQETLSYCRIGERSSHTWFVLTYLLGFTQVRNYDGSWTEWGNTVRAPIER